MTKWGVMCIQEEAKGVTEEEGKEDADEAGVNGMCWERVSKSCRGNTSRRMDGC